MTPRVFNIPASAPFLPVLVRALIEGKLIPGFPGSDDPLALAQLTLYLPTRRAVKLARETFLGCIGRDAAILPRIVAIGDIDEDELIFAQAATGELAEAALTLPQTLDPLERKLLLAQLVVTWASSRDLHGAAGTPLVANTPSAALLLADDLARLIDDMTTRGVGWDKLDELVPEQFDTFWQLSLRLLTVLRDYWPRVLDERGVIEAAERRDLLIKAETQRLTRSNAPVIVAGSTGSMPSTAELHRNRRPLAAWRGRAARPGHRRSTIHRGRCWRATRKHLCTTAACPHSTTRNMRCRVCSERSALLARMCRRWRRRATARLFCPKRCGPPRRPSIGRRGARTRRSPPRPAAPSTALPSSKPAIPRKKRWRSRSPCARRTNSRNPRR